MRVENRTMPIRGLCDELLHLNTRLAIGREIALTMWLFTSCTGPIPLYDLEHYVRIGYNYVTFYLLYGSCTTLWLFKLCSNLLIEEQNWTQKVTCRYNTKTMYESHTKIEDQTTHKSLRLHSVTDQKFTYVYQTKTSHQKFPYVYHTKTVY
jgi:hypothetical protein